VVEVPPPLNIKISIFMHARPRHQRATPTGTACACPCRYSQSLRSGLPVAAMRARGTACGTVAPLSHNPHNQASVAQASVTARCTTSSCCACAPNRSVLLPTQRTPPQTALPVVGYGRSRVPSRSEAPRLANSSGQVSIVRSTRTS